MDERKRERLCSAQSYIIATYLLVSIEMEGGSDESRSKSKSSGLKSWSPTRCP